MRENAITAASLLHKLSEIPPDDSERARTVAEGFLGTLTGHIAAALRTLPSFDAGSNTVAVHDVESAADRIYDDAFEATLRGDVPPPGLLPRIVSMWSTSAATTMYVSTTISPCDGRVRPT